MQQVMGGPPRLARLRKWAENLILLTLAPILLPLVLVVLVLAGLNAVKIRLETGEWPRNERFIARMKARK